MSFHGRFPSAVGSPCAKILTMTRLRHDSLQNRLVICFWSKWSCSFSFRNISSHRTHPCDCLLSSVHGLKMNCDACVKDPHVCLLALLAEDWMRHLRLFLTWSSFVWQNNCAQTNSSGRSPRCSSNGPSFLCFLWFLTICVQWQKRTTFDCSDLSVCHAHFYFQMKCSVKSRIGPGSQLWWDPAWSWSNRWRVQVQLSKTSPENIYDHSFQNFLVNDLNEGWVTFAWSVFKVWNHQWASQIPGPVCCWKKSSFPQQHASHASPHSLARPFGVILLTQVQKNPCSSAFGQKVFFNFPAWPWSWWRHFWRQTKTVSDTKRSTPILWPCCYTWEGER